MYEKNIPFAYYKPSLRLTHLTGNHNRDQPLHQMFSLHSSHETWIDPRTGTAFGTGFMTIPLTTYGSPSAAALPALAVY